MSTAVASTKCVGEVIICVVCGYEECASNAFCWANPPSGEWVDICANCLPNAAALGYADPEDPMEN